MASDPDLQRMLDDVKDAYHDPARGYHGWGHIMQCLLLLEDMRPLVEDLEAVQLALLFHDVVFVPGSPNNELLSAEKAEEWLRAADAPEVDIATVRALILDTKHVTPSETADGRLVQDIDLHGFTNEDFSVAANGIRHEFKDVSDEVYYPERVKILQWFLDKPRLYQTELFFQTYEQVARKNIQAEIDSILATLA